MKHFLQKATINLRRLLAGGSSRGIDMHQILFVEIKIDCCLFRICDTDKGYINGIV